jgi:hypothetical protein
MVEREADLGTGPQDLADIDGGGATEDLEHGGGEWRWQG